MKKVNIAVVGLGFGAEFIPIYQKYDKTNCIAVSRRSADKLNEYADKFGVLKRYADYQEVLKDPEIDAVHINTPIKDHGWMAIEALKAGKHVACAVPMSIKAEECKEIVRLEKKTGKVYMMMETSIYTREFLFFKKLFADGKIGHLQFLRGSHQQNMSLPGWPEYWYGLPPMYYCTHALAPLSEILRKPVETVRCIGSGRINEDYIKNYNSPFAVESMQITFKDSDVAGEVTRSLFDTIRQYRESFDFYGSHESFEWEQSVGENPVVFSGYEDAEHVTIPDTDNLLPAKISDFALNNRIVDEKHVSFIQGSGHGGSHPHLVYEFITSILEGRESHVSAKVAANWSVTGILAHDSAMQGGKIITVPEYAQF